MVKTLTDTELEYYAIIENRRNNPLPKGEYGEIHHIHPRSCGGSDCECNLVKLTPEEHYRCHCLLPKIFEEKRMSEARKGNGHPVSEETKKKISDSWKRRKEAK